MKVFFPLGKVWSVLEEVLFLNKRGILDLRLNLEIYLPFSKLIFRDFLENFYLLFIIRFIDLLKTLPSLLNLTNCMEVSGSWGRQRYSLRFISHKTFYLHYASFKLALTLQITFPFLSGKRKLRFFILITFCAYYHWNLKWYCESLNGTKLMALIFL